MKDRLILPVALVILFVWTAAACFSFISQQYTPLEIATPVMLILSGYVFGIQIARTNGRKNGPQTH